MTAKFTTFELTAAVVGTELKLDELRSTKSVMRRVTSLAFSTTNTGKWLCYKDSDQIMVIHTGVDSDDAHPLVVDIPLETGQAFTVAFTSSNGVAACYCRVGFDEEPVAG